MRPLRRLARTALARLRREESGFTLVELLMVITISSVIIVVIGAAFTAAAKASVDATTRLNESNDARLLSTYFSADAAGASSVSGTALPAGACSISDLTSTGASSVALFGWTDSSSVKKNAFYLVSGNQLIRRFCSAGVKVVDIMVNRHLSTSTPPALVCNPTNCLGVSASSVPASVVLTITEQSGYSYSVSVSPRGTDVAATNDTAPTVRSMAPAAATPSPSNLSQVQYQVLFSESVTGVDLTDFSLSSSPSGAAIASIIGVGGGTSYTVVVNTNSVGNGSNGTVTLSLNDNDTIKDRKQQPLNGTGTGTIAATPFIIDKVPPTVTLVQAATQADPSLPGVPIHFTATFSEEVLGFDASDVTKGGTAAGGTVSVSSAGSNVYDVMVSGLTSEGTVTVSIPAGKVTDTAGNANTTASSGADSLVNYGAPYVTSINLVGTSPTKVASVSWTVTFSETVSGVGSGDFSLINSGVPGTPLITSVSGSGSTYTVTASTGTGSGTLGVNLVDDDSIVDTGGLKLGGAGTGNGSFTGAVYAIDRTAPTVTLVQAATQTDPATTPTIHFTATFSEAVTNFDASKVTLGGTSAGSTVSSVASLGSNVYDVVVGLTSEGTVTASIAAAKVSDVAGNTNTASTGADNSVTFGVPYVSSINLVGTSPSSAAGVSWTVTFTEPVTGVGTADFSVIKTGVSGTPAVTAVTGTGATYTVTASTGTGSGTIGLNVVDDDSIIDGGGLKLAGVGAGNGNFTGPVYTIDKLAPTLTLVQAATQADPAGSSPILFTATFNEAVNGFDASKVTLGGTGASGATASVTTTGTNVYEVAVSGVTTEGNTITASVAAGKVTDVAGNANTASTGSDNTVTYDVLNPTVVSIVRAVASPTKATSVSWTVTFSETVFNVNSADFSLIKSGTTGTPAITAVSAASGTTITVTASTGTGTATGTLGLNLVDDDSITDGVGKRLGGTGTGNGSFTGEVYTITDRTAPTVSGIVLANGGTAGKADTGDTVTITYSEAMDATDFSSGWANNGSAQSSNVTVRIDAGDVLSVTSGGVTFGSVDLTGDYIADGTGTRYTDFNATASYNPTTKKLTITLGTVSADTGNRKTGILSAIPVYTPSAGLEDLAANALSTSAVNGSSSRF